MNPEETTEHDITLSEMLEMLKSDDIEKNNRCCEVVEKFEEELRKKRDDWQEEFWSGTTSFCFKRQSYSEYRNRCLIRLQIPGVNEDEFETYNNYSLKELLDLYDLKCKLYIVDLAFMETSSLIGVLYILIDDRFDQYCENRHEYFTRFVTKVPKFYQKMVNVKKFFECMADLTKTKLYE